MWHSHIRHVHRTAFVAIMPPGMRAVVVVAIVCGASVARAGTVELRYTAPTECPDRAAVEAAIRERTPVTFADGAERVFAITITPNTDGFEGALTVTEQAQHVDSADRQLAAHRCDDLVTALALITALAIDPTAVVAPKPPPPPQQQPPAPPATPGPPIEAELDGGIA